MFAQHRQIRRRLILAVAIGSSLLWSGIGMPIPAHAQVPDPSTQLYVQTINVGWTYVGGPKKRPVARVDIVDGNGTPLNGALVVGDWSGCFRQLNDSGLTETICWTADDGSTVCVDGRAVIWANRSHNCVKKNCRFTFTITGVQKVGMTYVPVEGKTSSSISCNP